MSNKSALTPLWSIDQVKRVHAAFQEKADKEMYKILQRTGEEFVKVARENGNYKDHSGNLRSSIGYVILKNGSTITQNFEKSQKEGTDKETGLQTAISLSKELSELYSKGYVLIGLAGMKYATYVEAMESKDVVSLAYTRSESFIKKMSVTLFNRIGQ